MPSRIGAARAAVAVAAAAASFCALFALCGAVGADTQPAIVAAILAIGLSRKPLPASLVQRLVTPLVLAVIALASIGIGLLMRTLPVAGAALFVGGMFLSVWLRNFGPRLQRAGSLIALPLVAMLIVPPPGAPGRGGPLVDLAMIVCAGLVPIVAVAAFTWLARLAGLPAEAPEPPAAAPKRDARPRAGLSVPTRMALQLAVALTLAFVAGFAIFPAHWSWAVLTAFIVCSGARGRGDAAYKGLLRLAGAVAGTIAAAAVSKLWAPTGVAEAVAIFGLLYLAIWLRPVSYAYWACAMTLVLALLARDAGGIDLAILSARLAAILAGAVCAVAATWFVFPIRTTDVVRRRLAIALAALDDVVAHAHSPEGDAPQKLAAFERHLGQLNDVAAPVRLHRRLGGDHPEHPARWVDEVCGLREHARDFTTSERPSEPQRAEIRKAIGASRRAIGNHGKPDAPADGPTIGTALVRVNEAFARTIASSARTPN